MYCKRLCFVASVVVAFAALLAATAKAEAQQGSLSAELVDGVLTISGNSEDDADHIMTALIEPTRVVVASESGFLARYDGEAAAAITEVKFVLGAGPDTLWLFPGGFADINVDTGQGNDDILVEYGGQTSHYGNVSINTGQGADRVRFKTVKIQGDTTIVTGQGNDRIHFGHVDNPSGTVSSFGSNLTISTGTNGDLITQWNHMTTVAGDLNVSGGQGNDRLFFPEIPGLINVQVIFVDGAARFSGDQGFDTLILDGDGEGPLNVFEAGTLEVDGIEAVIE